MVLALVMIVGLVVGSFITMASYRIPRDEGLILKRSHCPHCHHALGVKDLFPVVSWIARKGKCHYCQKPVSWRYPLIEITTALVFATVYLYWDFTWQSGILYVLSTSLLIMAVIDLEHTIIPDRLQVFHALVALILVATYWVPLYDALVGGLAGLAVALFLRYGYGAIRKKEMLGLGDVKFIPIACAMVGIKAVLPFFLVAGLTGTVLGLIWCKGFNNKRFPFGPALAFSLWVCLLFMAETWQERFSLFIQPWIA